ncbi:formimidoylglutamate deiminase [Amycolatopsis acidicola]|uniref:Formimidoylglutamate deiminase n=1 Tax=Amycolatopsis acidicola TaxID=2596893 RepID=A0A5N0VB40_9PSEU|nr:formimidoylglutamate deiminase [Amycolatopsis acidicola]KAA9163576.1 formimidoylglutamate deiminase [Amycolatopsis acidicola]
MTATRWWCEHAWLGEDTVGDGVLISVADGRITAVESDRTPPADARRLPGLVLPGMANAHSHAFHRALRSRTQRDRGSFWTWRELMYRAADRLDPDRYLALARAVYAEMALAGITAVGEFHYLHHDRGGIPYAEPNAMGHALVRAAADAGIRLTLLDTCYLSAGVDGTPLAEGPQQRFGDGSGEKWAERVEALHQQCASPTVRVGAALHSVRAVPVEHMPAVVEWADAHRAPLHVHSSEQTAEIDQCLAVHGRTPTAVLRDAGALGPRTTAVHATHLTDQDLSDLDGTATGVCFCPTTERDLGDGIGPAAALLAGSSLFSLGSDSHAVIDLFEEARAVELNERLDRRTRGNISAARLLKSSTSDGHFALGWDDAGHLRPGMRADLVAVDLGSLRTAGGGPTLENAVFAASAADVTEVVVDGRRVVADRVHLTVPAPARALGAAIGELLDQGGQTR